jgi:hypothetical protein
MSKLPHCEDKKRNASSARAHADHLAGGLIDPFTENIAAEGHEIIPHPLYIIRRARIDLEEIVSLTKMGTLISAPVSTLTFLVTL